MDKGQSTKTCTSEHVKELQDYLEEPVKEEKTWPLQYWSSNQGKYPNIAQVAVISVLGIPASSAPVERVFSVAGKVFRLDRCRLKDNDIS